ncbi:MAG: aldehyde dehydrogenase family protein [Myxococcota bacterium]|nr:aldehyde dehydrogenase family protein [Myxococcota bacterium]
MEHIQCRAPATGQLLANVRVDNASDVEAAVARARDAQKAWAQRPIQERSRILLKFRDLVLERGDELTELLSMECGKPRMEAYMAEIFTLVDLTTYFAKRAKRILKRKNIRLHLMVHRKSFLHYVPRGVIGIISPWNFPLIIPAGDMVIALLAGNAVVVKPSETTPLIVMKIRELFLEAGVPEDLVQVLNGYGETGAALVNAGVDKVIFTGSVATGEKIAESCGRQLIPCALELGGKAPFIVLPGANLERAARAMVWGAFVNSGQVCVSVERAYVHRSLYEPLVERVVALTNKLRQANPADTEIDVGAIIDPRQLDISAAQVADARAHGATIHTGGEAAEGPGQFFPPTVITDAPQHSQTVQKETFGPLLPILPYDTVEEAIELANDSHLGLMAYVFGPNVRTGVDVAHKIVSGMVMVDDVFSIYGMPETPWSGVKKSGLGRVHSPGSMRDMCMTIHINQPLIPLPFNREIWWYPYRPEIYAFVRRLMNFLFGRGLKKLAPPNDNARNKELSELLPAAALPTGD